MTQLNTIGVIARRLKVERHRIAYALRTHAIASLGRAGNARVFSDEAVQQLAQILGVELPPPTQE